MYALSGDYEIRTNLPLLGQFRATIPVADMADEGLGQVKSYLPWLVLGGIGVVFVGSALANWLLPGSSR